MPRYADCVCCAPPACCESYCESCQPCPGAPDIDITVEETDQEGPLAGSKDVRPCIGAACPDDVDSGAYVKAHVYNNTGECIQVQFFATFGVPAGCANIKGRFECESGGALYESGEQPWFYLCLSPDADITVCISHVLLGLAATCCEQQGTITGWRYEVYDGSGAPCNGCGVVEEQGVCCGGEGQAENIGCDETLPPENFGLTGDEMEMWLTCVEAACPACPSGTAWYLIDSRLCVDEECEEFIWDLASFSCCKPEE